MQGTAPTDMCNALHAAYGRDNYPNYLLKWAPERVDAHILRLERELAAAKAAAHLLAARDVHLAAYCRRADIPQTSRGDAAATTWIFRADKSRRRRGDDVDIPRRRGRPETED